MSIFADIETRLALGTLRLSTEGRPDELEARNLILYALNQGIRILDTADSYCLHDAEFHFAEHLIRQALRSWSGDRNSVRVLTKAGLTRPSGKWIPNGRPEHLKRSVDESLTALGVEQLFLLQLHVRDPQVPFEESLGAMADLVTSGKVCHVGLCNVSLADIELAASILKVAAVQNELSVLNTHAANLGVVRYCQENVIPFLAHRPLGGYARTQNLTTIETLTFLAERHDATAQEIALASILETAPHVFPIVGATRLKSIKSSLKALSIEFDVSDRTAMSTICSLVPEVSLEETNLSLQPPAIEIDIEPRDTDEVVVVMGIQGAGKSELVKHFLEYGYTRLNRDEMGGTLESLVPRLRALLREGTSKVVLDNTYPTQNSRHSILVTAREFDIPVRCIFLDTPMHEACANVVLRMVKKYGVPLGPDEMKFFRKADPNLPPPQALQKWVSLLERPVDSEGFTEVTKVPFVRRTESAYDVRGVLLDVDGTLRETLSGEFYPRSADDVRLLPRRTQVLRKWVEAGYQLFFVSNQSGIATGHVSHENAQAAMMRTVELLELPVAEVVYCSHPSRPVGCFCRKPMPGLGIYLIERHRLSREHLVMVGDRDTDAQFAAALGVRYFDESQFFGAAEPKPDSTG